MTIELIEVFSVKEGREIELAVRLVGAGGEEKKCFSLPTPIYEGLGLPEPPAAIDEEAYYELEYADRQYRAIRKAFDILAYGRNSEKTLASKLRARGFGGEIADTAARYMREHGYIKEEEDAIREVDCCFKKLWGSRRILMHLHEKKLDAEAVKTAREYMDTLDFVDNCVRLIRTKYGTLPKEEKERNRVISGLVRYGYSFTEIKAAAKVVEYYKLPE